MSRWKGLPGVTQIVPEVNLPGSIGLELKWNGTNQAVRLSGAEPMRGNFFQELPEPVTGSLELPESGGMVLSQGTAQSLGLSSNNFPGVIGQSVEAILRTSRGETQSYFLRVQGISRERSRRIQVSIADRIAMKNWWFNSTNVLEREGYDSVAIRSADVTRASTLFAATNSNSRLDTAGLNASVPWPSPKTQLHGSCRYEKTRPIYPPVIWDFA